MKNELIFLVKADWDKSSNGDGTVIENNKTQCSDFDETEVALRDASQNTHTVNVIEKTPIFGKKQMKLE